MPELAFVFRQSFKQIFRNDVFDAVQASVLAVAVEEHALRKVFVHLVAEVVGLHLMLRILLHRMEADQVDIHRCERRVALQQAGAQFQRARGG
jgi:hypothetical protein